MNYLAYVVLLALIILSFWLYTKDKVQGAEKEHHAELDIMYCRSCENTTGESIEIVKSVALSRSMVINFASYAGQKQTKGKSCVQNAGSTCWS